MFKYSLRQRKKYECRRIEEERGRLARGVWRPAKHTFAGCLLMDGGILGINM